MTDCIEYPKYRNADGYGELFREGRVWRAHRWAWTQTHGPIPEGMCVLHDCDNPSCWNVEHLRLGTQLENIADRTQRRRHRYNGATHCKHGHEFNEANTYNRPGGHRACRKCNASRKAEALLTRRTG